MVIIQLVSKMVFAERIYTVMVLIRCASGSDIHTGYPCTVQNRLFRRWNPGDETETSRISLCTIEIFCYGLVDNITTWPLPVYSWWVELDEQ